ncbi:MAG: cysteine desulfurase [Bacteroidia bacterium]|nr:cysteine desulfurase [Bacteroidia bacterium]
MNVAESTLLKPVSEFDIQKARRDFPILTQKVYSERNGTGGKPLIYFDNAATSQKPQVVIDALVKYYSEYNSNIHRGVHYLSGKASQAYDDVRKKAHEFIGSKVEQEIIFTRGTTESINLVASSWGRKNISEGDEIIISEMEHHSNIVPWQMLCEYKKAMLKIIPMNERGELLIDEFEKLISTKTKFISIVHTSNSLGTINPVKEIISIAHKHNIPVLVDAAQAMAHKKINIQDLDCDFLAFSGHKMLGPTGVGVLFGKLNLLEEMPPYQGGGEMIQTVTFEKTTYADVPAKFEAGTPNVADVIAFGAALDYWNMLDRKAIADYEYELMIYASEKLKALEGVRLIGIAKEKSSVVSFVIDGLNALDVGMYLDTLGVAVRTGHHCTEPVMDFYKIPGTIRASFYFYNTKEEIDVMVEGVKRAIQFLKK